MRATGAPLAFLPHWEGDVLLARRLVQFLDEPYRAHLVCPSYSRTSLLVDASSIAGDREPFCMRAYLDYRERCLLTSGFIW